MADSGNIAVASTYAAEAAGGGADDPFATLVTSIIGTDVGGYQVTELLGRGGMGAVFKGRHALLGRPAAIKLLLPHVGADASAVRRFFNEARATTAIAHPGIVQIYDFGRAPTGLAYIAMELLGGESLSARLKRGRLAEKVALTLVRQMASALAAAHAIGVVHRDLKPDNIFLVPDPEVPGGERVKLLDFGIAKLTADLGNSQHTQTGAFMGTPAYMSPEQCHGVAVDHRTDVYALGCILFELLVGRRAFTGASAAELIVAHISQPAPALTTWLPSATPAVATLVADMLRRNADQRPQTCDEVQARLDDCLRGARTVPTTISPPVGDATANAYDVSEAGARGAMTMAVGPSASRRRRWAWVAIGGTTVGAGVVAAVIATRPPAAVAPTTPPAITADGSAAAAAKVVEATPPLVVVPVDAAPVVIDAPSTARSAAPTAGSARSGSGKRPGGSGKAAGSAAPVEPKHTGSASSNAGRDPYGGNE